MFARGEGVFAVVEHALRVVLVVGGCLGAKVAEHGIRFPMAKEGHIVGVDVGAHEGSGAAGSEAAG